METLLTIVELAKILKVTEQTIRRYVRRGFIPFRKIGKIIRFRPSEIDVWINSGGLENAMNNDDGISDGLPVESLGK